MAENKPKVIRAKGAVRYLSRGVRKRILGMLAVLYEEGFRHPDFMARQLVDDLFRATGTSFHLRQHLVEEMATRFLRAKAETVRK